MALSACSKKGVNKQYSYEGDSYLPMEVGNYWRTNDENYIKITDTKMIDNGLFYEFSSRIGGDVFGKNYYRIDKDNNLIEKFPDHPGSVYTHAKFGAKVGDVFYTTGKKDWNDLYVKITYKGDEQITFEYDMINHPNLKGQKSYRSFKRGFGFAQNWKEVKIGDKVYKF
ncbi:hypothetical protein GCM10027516_29350 [Niabella aquatica]